MEQLEVISWKILDSIKNSATKIYEILGDIDTNEQMSVFCQVEEDYVELYYSEVDSNFIRHFEDEDEFFSTIEKRKDEFGEEEYDTMEYFDEDGGYGDENSGEDYDGYNIKEDEDENDY